MTTDTKALTRRWFDEVWYKRRTQTMDEMLAPETVVHGQADGGQPVRGVDGFRPFFERFVSAFSDISVVIDDTLAEGDKTAVRFHAEATHGAMGLRQRDRKPRALDGDLHAALEGWPDHREVERVRRLGDDAAGRRTAGSGRAAERVIG